MQASRKQIRALWLVSVVLMSGCATSTNYIPPVEERAGGRSSGSTVIDSPAGNDTAVVTAIGVEAPITPVSPVAPVTRVVEQPQPAAARNPAVLALLESAQQKQQQGAYSAAQSNLERAQRIAPRDPQVYYQLADLSRLQGQYLQAEQLALKGVAVAAGQFGIERKLWLLIADIRMEGGDSRGAQEARQKAARL